MPDLHPREPGSVAHRFAPAAPDEEHVYGACSPGWHTAADRDAALRDWITFMRTNDVERVCCLLSGCPHDAEDGYLEQYRETFGSDRVAHTPLPDQRLADETRLREDVLPFLDEATAADERVVVHCLAGIGRTGQVLAAWLAHDRSYGPERAIETVEGAGRHPTEPIQVGDATEEELHELLASLA